MLAFFLTKQIYDLTQNAKYLFLKKSTQRK